MVTELNGMAHSKSTNLNAQDNWNLMEIFISHQVASVLNPKQKELYNGLDQAFRILRGTIQLFCFK